jgi:hypothetical protein
MGAPANAPLIAVNGTIRGLRKNGMAVAFSQGNEEADN